MREFVESIGPMLRSFSQPALPEKGVSTRILQFGSMELDLVSKISKII
jgi:hypothetical protein